MNPPPTRLFITGTDTDVGKTFVSGLLLRTYCDLDVPVSYWKPVQTGPDSDCKQIKQTCSGFPIHFYENTYTFRAPQSPDQAARVEDAPQVDLEKLCKDANTLDNQRLCIIEGAGGVCVPLNDQNQTWLDFLAAFSCQTLLIARSGLGTLNHTIMSVNHLRQKNISIAGVILNGDVHSANLQTLQRFFPDLSFYAVTPQMTPEAFKSTAAALRSKIAPSSAPVIDYESLDQRYVWHPYTQQKTAPSPVVISSAKGPWVYTESDERLFDATASWWVNTIGHGDPEIAATLAHQQQQLDHVMFAGATHAPAVLLAQKLIELTRSDFQKVFYSDNGSTAVEVALKMAYQAWFNRGHPDRRAFLALNASYHGDTFGCMALGGDQGFHAPFAPFLFRCHRLNPLTKHHSRFNAAGASRTAALDEARTFLNAHHSELAAVVIEPLVQGAGGMLMHDPNWLREFCELCRSYDLPIIFDEVFVGMGRAGAMYAYQRLGLVPDLLCLAKGLTGGTLPLAVTLAPQRIFESFLADDLQKALLHGHSYTANPISCAVALKTLDLYQRHDLIMRAQTIEQKMQAWITTHTKSLSLENPRVCGAILAFELPKSGASDYFKSSPQKITAIARAAGLFLRPLGNTIYLTPPLRTTDHEFDFALEALTKTIRTLEKAD